MLRATRAWTRLPVFNLPLCQWSSGFLDLRAPSTLSSCCLYHICPTVKIKDGDRLFCPCLKTFVAPFSRPDWLPLLREMRKCQAFTRNFSTFKTKRKLGRVSFHKDFWDRNRARAGPIFGTLRNYDGHGKENVKQAIGLMSKTKTLHMHHTFFTFLCCPCTTMTWNDQILSLLKIGNG